MRKLFREFRDFIAKGSVIDLAVGVIIGAAFKAIVDSLVSDILSPLIGLVADTHLEGLVLQVGKAQIGFGAFLSAILNFLLMAVVLFVIVKVANRARELEHKVLDHNEPPPVPTTRPCPFCRQAVPIEATRCPFCTSELPPA